MRSSWVLLCIFMAFSPRSATPYDLEATSQIWDLIASEDVTGLRKLLNSNSGLLQAEQDGASPLFRAVKDGRLPVVETLLEFGADPARLNGKGNTPVSVLIETPSFSNKFKPLTPRSTRRAILEQLIRHGADLDKAGPKGSVPLHAAAFTGDVVMLKLLLENGANPNSVHQSMTPLFLAARFHRLACVRLLLKHGADPKQRMGNGESALNAILHNTPMRFICANYPTQPVAAEIVKVLLAAGSPIDIFAAAALGDLDRISALAKQQPDSVNARRYAKVTPLVTAIHSNQVEAVRLLLKLGADPNLGSALHESIFDASGRLHSPTIAEILLDAGADPNAKAEFSSSLLAKLRNWEKEPEFRSGLRQLLLDHGATGSFDMPIEPPEEVRRQRTRYGRYSPLPKPPALVVMAANDQLRPSLLQAKVASTAVKERAFKAALFNGRIKAAEQMARIGACPELTARDRERPEVVRQFVKRKIAPYRLMAECELGHVAVVRDYLNVDAVLPLHAAAMGAVATNRPNILRLLAGAGVDFTASLGRIHSGLLGQSPVEMAVINGRVECLKLFFDLGLPVKYVFGDTRDSIIHVAASTDQPDIVALGIKMGLDPDAKNAAGFTPLHLAASRGSVRAARILVENGVTVESLSPQGLSPLHLAVSVGTWDMTRWLISCGADVARQDAHGQSALDFAIKHRRIEWIKMLAHGKALGLFAAISLGDTACCRELLLANPQLIESRSFSDRRTPLIHACLIGHREIARMLIEEFDAFVNASNENGDRPLHVVSHQDPILTSIKADCFFRTGFGGQGLKDRDDCAAVARMLLDYCADPNAVNRNGDTPLDAAKGRYFATHDIVSALFGVGAKWKGWPRVVRAQE